MLGIRISTLLRNKALLPSFDSLLRRRKTEAQSIMTDPSGAVTGRGPITHVVFDMDGLLLGNSS